ncbi:AAA family ATPase [Ensifer sesbaniae]|uniref:AAA family ATPase n=1 Tax=Ensifer sesbaniae TaxID=1214071 RepID=UPI00200146C0|nr:AAA family ATPase [Ensifer sesbaniae]
MLEILNSTPTGNWDLPEPSAKFTAKHPADDLTVWEELRERVAKLARQQSWTKAEVARRMGMADSSFHQWLSGNLLGVLENQNSIALRWLDAVEESAGMAAVMPSSPAFLKTRAAVEIHATLLLAQTMSGFVTITLDAGRGKTMACREYQRVKPHVHMVTLNPKVKTVHGAMNQLSRKLAVRVFNQAELVETIGERLSRGSDGALLIIDEAQHADTESVNQFRYFSDNFKVGVALVGNAEIRRKMSQGGINAASRDQILSRIDKNLKKDPGREADVRAFVEAWGIHDPSCIKFLVGLGLKGGALRQVDRTIKIAHLAMHGSGEPLQLKHLQAAWRNRDVEDI